MELLRKFLVFLRKEYKDNPKNILIRMGAMTIVAAIACVLVDSFLPFNGYWNILRSALVGLLAVPMFAFGYLVSLYLHFEKVSEGDGWVPFRARLSSTWRLRVFAVFCAILFVMALNLTQNAVYTFSSGALAAALLAGIAFIRLSSSEAARESLGIPDARDILNSSHKDNFFKEREAQREEKKAAKIEKKTRGSKKKEVE